MKAWTLVLMAALSVIPAHAGVADFTEGRDSLCPLHRIEMRTAVVPIQYGLPMFDARYEKAKQKNFPNANDGRALGGCMVGPESEREAKVFFCPRCNQARAAWLKKRPALNTQ